MPTIRSAVLLFLSTLHCLRAQDTTGVGSLHGTVLEESTGAALPGAAVCLQAPQQRCGITSAEGRFRITDIRPGMYSLEIRPHGTSGKVTASVEIRAGIDAAVELLVPALGTVSQSVEVRASASAAPEEVKTSSHLLSAREVQQDASSTKDVARYVQVLPGVVFGGDDFRNDIVVRGGSPLENLYIVDNVEVPNISHFGSVGSAGGAVGMLNSELLSDVTFLTGGYPAPYSNRLSSVLQITQREGSRERIHTHATVGFSGGGGMAEGPLTPRGSWIVSARRSFLDLLGVEAEGGGAPVYTNVQGKAVYDVNGANRLWLLSIGGWDTIRERPDPAKQDQEDEITNVDYRGFRNASGFNWQKLFGARGVGLLGATFSRGHIENLDRDLRLNNVVVARQNLIEDEYTLKYDVTLNLPWLEKLQAGANARWLHTNFDYAQPIGVENPFSPLPGRVDRMSLSDRSWTGQPSGYLQITRSLGGRASLTAGGRMDRYGYARATRFSPRAGLNLDLAPRLALHLSYGVYYQQPFLLYLKADPVNRGLSPMRSDHYVAGLTYAAGANLLLSVEAYEKRYRDYPVSLEYPQVTLASAGDNYDPSFYLLPMTSAGRGRARGIEFYARRRMTDRLYGQVNFSIAGSRRTALDGICRPGGFDARYVFNLTGGYRIGAHWEVAGRFVIYSGRPYTPFDETLSRAQNRPIYDLAQVNALRAPSYQRLDFRVDRTFRVWRGHMNVYGGLTNAFNRENYFGHSWSYSRHQPKRLTQLGILPLCGLEWRF